MELRAFCFQLTYRLTRSDATNLRGLLQGRRTRTSSLWTASSRHSLRKCLPNPFHYAPTTAFKATLAVIKRSPFRLSSICSRYDLSQSFSRRYAKILSRDYQHGQPKPYRTMQVYISMYVWNISFFFFFQRQQRMTK